MISAQRRRQIQGLAERLWRLTGKNGPPVPVEEVAEERRIIVIRTESDERISGRFISRWGDKHFIGVNSLESKDRQRFAIAHAVGHFELHEFDYRIESSFRPLQCVDNRDGSYDVEEYEANVFAAALLMPSELLRNQLKDYTFDYYWDEKLESLALSYDVAVQVMTNRLTHLGLMDSNPRSRADAKMNRARAAQRSRSEVTQHLQPS